MSQIRERTLDSTIVNSQWRVGASVPSSSSSGI